MNLIFTIILVSITLSACSFSPDPSVQYQSRFDFSEINTYSLNDRNSYFSELQNISSGMRNSIELSIEKRLDGLGLTYESPEKADVIVNYYLVTASKVKLQAYNKSVKYCEHCLNFYSGSRDQKNWQKLPGSLLVDLVETKQGRSIWRSIQTLNIQTKDSRKKIQTHIDAAILKMFTENPQHISGML